MRGLTSTLILLVVLGALGGYIYFVDSKRPAGDATTKEQVFPGLSADDVDEIRVAVAGGTGSADGGDARGVTVTRARKANGQWTLVEPLQTSADQNALASITGSLASLQIERVLDNTSGKAKSFGLDPAHVDVRFHVKGRPGEQHLILGDKTPAGGNVYAQVAGTPRVFLVNESFVTIFGKDTFALRDKQALRIDRDKVDQLDLSSGSLTAEFTRSGSDWRIVKPIEARGDYGTIENVVERLASLQMQSLVAQDATSLAMYGLDKPVATFTATSGSSRATLILGRTENGLTFAKDVSRPMVFTVTSTLEADLIKPIADYRRKDLFDSRSFTATRVEFQRDGTTRIFEKTQDKDKKDIWRDATGKAVDAMKIEDLLARMTALRADTFEPGTLGTPALTVRVAFSDKRMETVSSARAGTKVRAARADEKGTATLDAMPFEDMLKALDALK